MGVAPTIYSGLRRLSSVRGRSASYSPAAWTTGASGAQAIKARSGRVIVQNRASAAEVGMPSAAISTGCVDLVLPRERIGHVLISPVMWPGASYLLRVPMSPWARPDG
jgi:hypothetical protein